MLNPSDIKDIQSIEKCRNIVFEIVKFGVNDNEIFKIIELLSLELENTTIMKDIHNLLKPKEEQKDVKESLII